VILIDTSVWVSFFKDQPIKQVSRLIELIEQKEELCICGVILTEILQGIRNLKERERIENLLNSLLFFSMKKETFILAADLYCSLRKQGITIRKTIDCMIAAVAIENKIPLLHNDRDFDPITKYCGLQVDQ
jgi:predicted nucleic acid-binding protein